MELPINLGKIRELTSDLENETKKSVSINIYIDGDVNDMLLQSVVGLFDEASDSANVNCISLSNHELYLETNPDFAIVLSANDMYACVVYTLLQRRGIECVIVTVKPHLIYQFASENSLKIYKCDIVCPHSSTYSQFNNGVDFNYVNEEMVASIISKLIDWMTLVISDSELAFASKFSCLKEKVCNSIIQRTALINGGIGVFNIISKLHIPIMTYNQAKMILQIATIYGYKLDEERIPELVVLAISSYAMKIFSNKFKSNNLALSIVNIALGYGGTYLLGNLALMYFKSGRPLENFASIVSENFVS